MLAVLPATGGLTRVVDKRKVRRDLADVFCTVEEGIKGKRAVDWRLIDEMVPRSKFDERVSEKALEIAASNCPSPIIAWVEVTRSQDADFPLNGTFVAFCIDSSSSKIVSYAPGKIKTDCTGCILLPNEAVLR